MVPAGRAHRGARWRWALALTLGALTARMVMPPAGLAAEEEGVSDAPPYPHLQVKADNTLPLNVRPEPNTRHEPLGALAPQDRTRYAIVGKDAAAETWWQIRFRDAAGRAALGWVHGAYVEAYRATDVPVTWPPATPAPDCDPPLPRFPVLWYGSLPPPFLQVTLDRSGQALSAVPAEAWAGQAGRQALLLNDNRLRRLSPEAFAGLPRLQVLFLSGNELTSLPPDLFRPLPCLRELHLTGNALTALPPNLFVHTPRLEVLNLTGNELTSLPPDLFPNLKRLQHLSLDANQLTALPPGLFRNLNRLQYLSLAGNPLTALPPDLFPNLKRLQMLWLADNALTALPPNLFRDLERLRHLSLAGNQLTALPPGLFRPLERLQTLQLSENRLASLPPGLFRPLERLQTLRLSENRLASLPSDLFTGLAHLQTLWLHRNQLAYLPPDLFRPLERLGALSLDANQLTTLPPDLFRGLARLQTLHLDNNQLACLPPDLFAPLACLSELRLSDNHLGNLAPAFFRDQGLTQMQTLHLGTVRGADQTLIATRPFPSQVKVPAATLARYVAALPRLETLSLGADGLLTHPACAAAPPAASAHAPPGGVRFVAGADAPRVGRPLVANAGPSRDRYAWRWERCADAAGQQCRALALPAPTPSAAYVPGPEDVGRYLRAYLAYLDADGTWTRLPTALAGPVAPLSCPHPPWGLYGDWGDP